MPSIFLKALLLFISLMSSVLLHAQTAGAKSKNLRGHDISSKKMSPLLPKETLSSVLLDSLTKSPIAYASIVLKNNQGVITNEEGAFSIQLPKDIQLSDSITVSSMGYEKKQFLLSAVQDTLLIASKEIVLNGVIVSNKNLSAQEIVHKIKENLSQNHPQKLTTKRLFFRASENQYMSKMDVDFKKSSIGALNKKFIDSVMGLIPRNGAYFTEVLADLHGDYTQKNQKIKLIKASKLYDKENEVSFEGIEKKFDEIFEQNVKKDSYLKVKSGWFSTKVSSDDLFYEEAVIDSSNVALLDSLATLKKEKDLAQKQGFANYRKNRMGRLFERLFFNEDSPFDFLFKDNRYDIRLEDFTYLGALPVYQLRFTSKGRSDYNAVLYVNADDFGVVRLDFKNSQTLKRVKLLGFSYVNYLSEGKAFFTKTEDLGYQLSYLEESSAEKVGIKRPIKIVEKNKNTRGRRKQNELIVAIDFEINSQNKNEIVVFSHTFMDPEAFKTIKEDNNILPTYLPKYDPNFWEGYNIIEPNTAIKSFSALSEIKPNN
jgi:hypothetical protein